MSATDTPPTLRESYQDLIKKAQNLTLQHDRLQATQILARAIRSEHPGTVAYKQLRKSLSSLAEMFYTEKAQKAFELAESSVEPRAAIDRYNEALGNEPGNTKILRSLARTKIRLGECVDAAKTAEAALETDPFALELLLLHIQTLQCSDDKDGARALLVAQAEALRGLKPGYDMAVIRDLMAQKKWPEARRRAKELESADAGFPEVKYALFRIGQEMKSTELEAGELYVEICQKSADRLRKKYELEPSLCLAYKDVEVEVRALRSQEDKKF